MLVLLIASLTMSKVFCLVSGCQSEIFPSKMEDLAAAVATVEAGACWMVNGGVSSKSRRYEWRWTVSREMDGKSEVLWTLESRVIARGYSGLCPGSDLEGGILGGTSALTLLRALGIPHYYSCLALS